MRDKTREGEGGESERGRGAGEAAKEGRGTQRERERGGAPGGQRRGTIRQKTNDKTHKRRPHTNSQPTTKTQTTAGFLVNRVLLPSINEAFFCLMEGVGTAADIDLAMKLGTNQPVSFAFCVTGGRQRLRVAISPAPARPRRLRLLTPRPQHNTNNKHKNNKKTRSSAPWPSPTPSASTPCCPSSRSCSAGSATPSTGPAPCCATTSTPGGSGARRGAACTCVSLFLLAVCLLYSFGFAAIVCLSVCGRTGRGARFECSA